MSGILLVAGSGPAVAHAVEHSLRTYFARIGENGSQVTCYHGPGGYVVELPDGRRYVDATSRACAFRLQALAICSVAMPVTILDELLAL